MRLEYDKCRVDNCHISEDAVAKTDCRMNRLFEDVQTSLFNEHRLGPNVL